MKGAKVCTSNSLALMNMRTYVRTYLCLHSMNMHICTYYILYVYILEIPLRF